MTAQYQSFPGAAGDSRTLDKLKALALPDLVGRSFLDVGCNEGFFCGFAQHIGARRVVGIDHGAQFVQRAKARFPGCEFLHRGWDQLPDEKFDVILLASALHYADDQPALIAALVDRLAPGGVLVLELGILSSPKSEWVKVKRGIDTRLFPTMDKLREVLKGYAWKWMGPSVTQDGDPVKRHVLHISRRLPVAYLLMQPPGFGKSSLAGRLFPKAKVKLIAGDRMIDLIARGQRKAGDALRAVIAEDYSPFRMDRTIERIFAAGLAGELVDVWLRAARGRDFAIEGYVPAAFQPEVEQRLRDAGCLPIRLEWQKPGLPLLPRADLEQRAEAFYLSMAEAAAGEGRQYEAAGFVDEATLDGGQLVLRGWAVTAAGRLPRRLHVAIDGRTQVVDVFEREMRVDVQAHLGLPHALYGWRATVDAPGIAPAALATLTVEGEDDDGALTRIRYSGAQAGS